METDRSTHRSCSLPPSPLSFSFSFSFSFPVSRFPEPSLRFVPRILQRDSPKAILAAMRRWLSVVVLVVVVPLLLLVVPILTVLHFLSLYAGRWLDGTFLGTPQTTAWKPIDPRRCSCSLSLSLSFIHLSVFRFQVFQNRRCDSCPESFSTTLRKQYSLRCVAGYLLLFFLLLCHCCC